MTSALLGAGANANARDTLGGSPLAEAIKGGWDSVIDQLLAAGAVLSAPTLTAAAELCGAVFEGDAPRLRRLLRAGAPVDAADYDMRTALHIAASEGSLQAARMLVEAGGRGMLAKVDRWGNRPVDDARRAGAAPVVKFLEEAEAVSPTAGGAAGIPAGWPSRAAASGSTGSFGS